MYTNEAVSSYKYYKKRYDTYMGFMIYNITFKILACVNLMLFNIYKKSGGKSVKVLGNKLNG